MFEKYIKTRRGAFDEGSLPEGHEARFAQRIKAAKAAEPSITIPLRRIWQAAAAGLLILISVQTASFFLAKQDPLENQPPQEVLTELSDIDIYYGSKMRKESHQLEGEAWEQLEVSFFLKKDLKALDKEYEELKMTILQEGRNEYLIEALIQNYRERIELLQEISNIIQQTKTDHESEKLQSS